MDVLQVGTEMARERAFAPDQESGDAPSRNTQRGPQAAPMRSGQTGRWTLPEESAKPCCCRLGPGGPGEPGALGASRPIQRRFQDKIVFWMVCLDHLDRVRFRKASQGSVARPLLVRPQTNPEGLLFGGSVFPYRCPGLGEQLERFPALAKRRQCVQPSSGALAAWPDLTDGVAGQHLA